MPKVTPMIPDSLLIAHLGDRSSLSDEIWLLTQQVKILTGRSIDQLEQDRIDGTPPPAMRPWGEKGGVRYRLGTVRDWMFGQREFNNNAEMRDAWDTSKLTGKPPMKFADFLDTALPLDTWPITVHAGVPIDFFKSIGMTDVMTDDDVCEIVTLDEYLVMRRNAAIVADKRRQDGLLNASVDAVLTQPLPHGAPRKRLGERKQ